MAEYLTPADLEAAFGADELIQRADRDGDGRPDPALLVQAIERAEAALDNACRGRYRVPLPEIDAETRGALLDLARFFLYEDGASDEVRARHDAAMAYLDKIAAGKRRLSAPPPPETARPTRVHAEGDRRELGRSGLRGVW